MTTAELAALGPRQLSDGRRRLLFWACFVALVATAVAFVSRSFILGALQERFYLTETQKGEILGAGLWPFGLSIVLFSLIIDKIGYGKSMIFAFICHVGCVVMYFMADGYQELWIASALAGLGAGVVEAVVNPIVATLYPKNKTKMLTILHGGWAGGVALGGLMVLLMANMPWQARAGILLVPTLLYAVMMLRCKFPVNERVAAGVPYRDMLKECGILGILIVSYLILTEVGRLLNWKVAFTVADFDVTWVYVVTAGVVLLFGFYTRAIGKLMYSFMLLIMILLATTELGTDGWMKELRDPGMRELGIDGGWVLVYTASIMVIMRFCISPFVKVLKPLGVLLMGSLFAAVGLYTLAAAELPWIILLTATIYGIGQAFFWPVTIGIVAERFPRGGALTINAIAGVGMLGVGIIGFPLMGNLQDTKAVALLDEPMAKIYVETEEKTSVLGPYLAIDQIAVNRVNSTFDLATIRAGVKAKMDEGATPEALTAALADNADYVAKVNWAYDTLVRDKKNTDELPLATMVTALTEASIIVDEAQFEATVKVEHDTIAAVKKDSARYAMQWIAILPLIMAACYISLMIYFKAKGGYKAIELDSEGKQVGEHPVTPAEAVADAEATPSE
jgi:MFS family permease